MSPDLVLEHSPRLSIPPRRSIACWPFLYYGRSRQCSSCCCGRCTGCSLGNVWYVSHLLGPCTVVLTNNAPANCTDALYVLRVCYIMYPYISDTQGARTLEAHHLQRQYLGSAHRMLLRRWSVLKDRASFIPNTHSRLKQYMGCFQTYQGMCISRHTL